MYLIIRYVDYVDKPRGAELLLHIIIIIYEV